jgi:hypothetical protein
MTHYTPEQVRQMTDAELCEALSNSREEKPGYPGYQYPDWNYWSEGKNWEWSGVSHTWKPIDWFLPENWTRILEEIKSDIALIEWDKVNYVNPNNCNIWVVQLSNGIYFDNNRLSRAVLEAALIVESEKK